MSNHIEVIGWDQAAVMSELAHAVYACAEPGFQIDGVETYHQLKFVIGALQDAAPRELRTRAQINNLFEVRDYYRQYPSSQTQTQESHIDRGRAGLAIHQNISDSLPVAMATADQAAVEQGQITDGNLKLAQGFNLRHGLTIPGRLTVFSEGNLGSLLPTIHHFDRANTGAGHSLWARYEHELSNSGIQSLWWRRRAKKVLRQIVSNKIAA